jgi:anti-sigma factor RsiW
MTRHDRPGDTGPLLERLLVYLDGGGSADERCQVETILRQDPAARELLRDLATLRERGAGTELELGEVHREGGAVGKAEALNGVEHDARQRPEHLQQGAVVAVREPAHGGEA